jgi:hypothetical protein
MKTLALDDNGDRLIYNSNWVVIDDIDAIRQVIITKIKLYLGEWFKDVSLGVPWIQQIFRKGTSLGQVQSILIDEILSVEGATEMKKFEMDFDAKTRKLAVDFNCKILGENEEFSEVLG